MSNLEQETGNFLKMKMTTGQFSSGKGEEKEGPREGKGGSFYIINIYSLYQSDK